MSDIGVSEGASGEVEKPVPDIEDVKFPPFPDPSDKDFDEDLSVEEKAYYKIRFPDINTVVNVKLHCTACDRHLGCSARNESRMRPHPMLRTLICHTCHSFYNSGEFDRGEDGSELYCRWCGQGGQVYCCSDCIHVFCAKCIKRNLGISKIKEIENTDDWKCFKCNPKCLWELRAVCWALLRFCDIRNKILHHTEDRELKEKYQRAIATDMSDCCRNKGKRKEKVDSAKKKEKEVVDVKKTILPKLPPTIQVKKFASINIEEAKKAQKRPASPKVKIPTGYIQKPIAIAPCTISTPPIKKVRMTSSPLLNPLRMTMERKIGNTYSRVPMKPRQSFPMSVSNNPFNGIQNPFSVNMQSLIGDNINLSLETLTQGLDMAAVAAFNNNAASNTNDNDVVCTPDFPLEPMCEVTEDADDDVECITPAPVVPPKLSNNPPPLVPRSLSDFSNDNVVQMTENDVTVNALTGGLKFRVDPQTLSSKKMYRLPDGRIFAINPNPNMPGGYSATIVSVSETGGKTAAKGGETFAAKLSAVTSTPTPSGSSAKTRSTTRKLKLQKALTPGTTTPKGIKKKVAVNDEEKKRHCDLKVPVEWYRYNLIDAVDALDYSLSRLNKLKKEATTGYLRTRTVDEIKYLHRTLEQLLTTSSKRFIEIRDNLNRELKQFITKKAQLNPEDVSEDDDDVEFLPNTGNDDPIFIDENSIESVNANENQEVDLTGVGSSEHNDSAENKNESDLLCNEDSIVDDKDVESAEVLGNKKTDDRDVDKTEDRDVDKTDDRDVDKTDDRDVDKTDDRDIDKTDDRDVDKTDDRDVDRTDSRDGDKTDSRDGEKTDSPNSNSEQTDNASAGDKPNGKSEDNPEADVEDLQEEIKKEKDERGEDGILNYKDDDDTKEDGNETTSDLDDNLDSRDESISDQKAGETNGDVTKEDMDVDQCEQNGSKVKSEESGKQTEDSEMSEDMIEALLKNDDTLEGDNISNTNSMDILEDPGKN